MPLADLSKLKLKDERKLVLQVDRFNGGVNTLLSAPRLKSNEAIEARNLMLAEDGIWVKRWGTDYYGGDAGGSIVDGFAEYRKTDGTRELIIFANGLARKKNGESWDTISGYTPTAGTPVYSAQIGNYLYACNGTDSLARYDGSSFTDYTALSAPANVAGARATLTDGNFVYYCEVTALNSVGETIASTEASLGVNKSRDTWTTGETITWTWDAVASAVRYNVYLSDVSGDEGKVAEVAQMTNPTWVDDGTAAINPYIDVPDANSTGGPKFRYLCISDNRLWGVGDTNAPWRVYWSGKLSNIGNFTWPSGGGWWDLEKGGKAVTKGIIDYQGRPTIFCPTPEGRGSIWQITLAYDSTYNFWNPTLYKMTNQISSLAPRSIIQAENDVFFATKRGVYLLGNEPNVTSNVLRTNELSAKIRDYIEAISDSDLANMCAYYKDGKVFFATPSRTFYYDRERLCWVKDWTVGFSQLGEYTDSDGVTHFVGGMSTDGYILKISESYRGDCDVAFTTSYLSPHIPVSKDWTKFAKIQRAFINLGESTGAVSFAVMGMTKKGSFTTLASHTISPGVSSAGLGWDRMGDVQLGDSGGYPTTYAEASTIRYMKVNKLLREVQFQLTTNTMDSSYKLLGLRAEGFPVETGFPSAYKLT